ncbi:MAG: Radical SAM domain protein, partial [Parcubacteria group bacterium GW2011_GWA1_36_12]
GKMIKFCKNLGVNVSAFYIFGLEGDTEKTIKETMNYAIKMNTLLARFSVSTPYPGTSFYNQLKKEERLLTDNFEEYTQFNLVYKHENLSPECVRKLLERAMRKYYFRPSYAPNLIKNKIMSFL